MARKLPLTLRFWVPVVAGIALLVRFPFLFGRHDVPPGSDDEYFLQVAASLADGNGYPGHFWMPGYMMFEAVVSALPGRTADTVTILQHLLGAGVCVGMLVVAWRWFGRVPAVMASLLAAASPVLVAHEHRLLPDFLFGAVVFAGAVALAAAVRAETPRTRLLLLTGLIFGVAVWVKAAGVFLVGAAPLTLLLVTRSPKGALRGAALVTAVLAITISPWLARNWHRYGDPHLSVQSGQALFNRVYDVDGAPLPDDSADARFARRVQARIPDDADLYYEFIQASMAERGQTDEEAIRIERRLALQGVREHPGSYLVGTVRELGRPLGHIRQFDGRDALLADLDRTDPPFPRAAIARLWDGMRWAVDVWWVLTVLTLTALIVPFTGSRERRAAGAALLSVWLCMALGTALSNGSEWRYSIQLAPITWILASAGAATLIGLLSRRLRARARSAGGRSTPAPARPRAAPDPAD